MKTDPLASGRTWAAYRCAIDAICKYRRSLRAGNMNHAARYCLLAQSAMATVCNNPGILPHGFNVALWRLTCHTEDILNAILAEKQAGAPK